MEKNELGFTIKGTPASLHLYPNLPCVFFYNTMDQQQPQSIIKKPSKFSRLVRFIFGSCGGKSVEKTKGGPPDMICKDMFLGQSTVVPAGTSDDDITPSIFAKYDVRYDEENKLKVVLVSPPNSPVLSPKPINRTLKQVPAYEPSILKDQVLRKVESLTQRHTVKATSPKKYSVRPNIGIIKPKSTCEFTVKMQPQRVAPPDMICKDMFLVQSTVVPAGTSDDDITPSIFAKDDVRYVEENKLKVVLVSPPNSPVLSPKPINRTLKQVPAYEPSILKDQVLRKVESLTQRHTVTEDVESKVENSEEANSAKNLEYKTRKDADEPLMNVGYKTRKEVDEPTTDVEHKTRMDVDEPTTDVEHKTMNDMEELKLVKDVSEMKSKLNGLESKLKLNGLESKLSEAEVIISKLTEERRLNAELLEKKGSKIKMQAQRVAPPDMICKDMFLVQSTVVPAGTSDDDITPSIFAKDDVRYVEENKLKVVLVSPPNSPVLSPKPINRTLKQVPAYEPSILKDQVLRKVESLTQRHTVTEDVESKVENSEEANSAKNLEYKTRKDADEPLMNVGYKTRKEVDEPTTDVEHKTRMDVDEPTTDVEHKTMNDMEELKLVKDVSEMKSKLNGLESKLSEAEVTISKLTEERRLNAQERGSLRRELTLLMSKRLVSVMKNFWEIQYMPAFI